MERCRVLLGREPEGRAAGATRTLRPDAHAPHHTRPSLTNVCVPGHGRPTYGPRTATPLLAYLLHSSQSSSHHSPPTQPTALPWSPLAPLAAPSSDVMYIKAAKSALGYDLLPVDLQELQLRRRLLFAVAEAAGWRRRQAREAGLRHLIAKHEDMLKVR